MENYIGTKQLKAVEMNLGDYNEKRGWTIPENEDPKREGYFVEYEDGYVSWSPKEVFEASYIQVKESGHETTAEAPHQVRVVDEATELLDKATKLETFISSNTIFEGLDEAEKKRLRLQLSSMKCYYSVLSERIANF